MVENIILGLILILLGTGFLMKETMGLNFNFYLKTYWPSILIIIGLGKLLDKKSSKTGGLFLIIIGTMLQINVLDIIDFNIWKIFFPILIILFGISLLVPKKYKHKEGPDSPDYENIKYTSTNSNDGDYIRETTILSGLNTRNQSRTFKGGTLTAILGGIQLDLRGADIQEQGAFLEANVLFGGIDILVPDHWKVEMSGTPILGGWDNKTSLNTNPDAPVLRIKVFVACGGLDVK